MIHFDTLENCSVAQITHAFNRSFEGYEIPLRFEIPDFERKLLVENFSPKHSIGAFDEQNELIGFIIHCQSQNAKALYNSGTGVVADFRGEKVTQRMYQFGLEKGFFSEFNEIVLEVLINNKPAYKSYTNVGFALNRHFVSYKGFPTQTHVKHEIENLKLTEELMGLLEPIATTKPSWQNNNQTMILSKEFLEVYVVKSNDQMAGYLMYNPLSKRIHQIAVGQKYRGQGIATSLISFLYQKHPYDYTMINVDKNDLILNKWLQKMGFEPFVFLDELVCSL